MLGSQMLCHQYDSQVHGQMIQQYQHLSQSQFSLGFQNLDEWIAALIWGSLNGWMACHTDMHILEWPLYVRIQSCIALDLLGGDATVHPGRFELWTMVSLVAFVFSPTHQLEVL